MSASPLPKTLLIVATSLLVVSTAVFGGLAWRAQSTATLSQPALTAAPYVPVGVDAPVVKNTVWEAPSALARGRDWLYDLFTPPEIFYNTRTRQFAVSAPLTGDEAAEAPFGLELVSVRPEPFRLQLIGYVGGVGAARGIFENRRTGEVFLASAGHRFADLALEIKAFNVRAEAIVIPESTSFNQRVATATIHDLRAQRDLTLTQRERQFTGNVFGLVALEGESAPREVLAGDTVKFGATTYRIERIAIDPATIEVTKTDPDLAAPVRRTLPLRFDPTETAPLSP
jgi:hypothetical protein